MRWGNQTDVKKHSQVLTEKRKRKGTHKKQVNNLKTEKLNTPQIRSKVLTHQRIRTGNENRRNA